MRRNVCKARSSRPPCAMLNWDWGGGGAMVFHMDWQRSSSPRKRRVDRGREGIGGEGVRIVEVTGGIMGGKGDGEEE